MSKVKTAFISDLHFDHNPGLLKILAARLEELEPDLLIIAGDIMSGVSRTATVIKELKKYVPQVAALPGNHDLWSTETNGLVSSFAIFNKIFKKNIELSGGVFLGKSPYYTQNFAIVGATSWYRKFPSPPIVSPDQKMCIFPGMEDPIMVLNWQLGILKEQLEEASQKTDKIIVVTHTLPFPSLLRKEIPKGVFQYMGADKTGRLILRYPKVKLIVSGHFHKIHSLTVGKSKIPWELRPLGYPGETGKNLKESVKNALWLTEL